jgi:hypothetical protein
MADIVIIAKSVPAMEEYKRKKLAEEAKNDGKEYKFIAVGAVIGAIALALAEWLFGLFSKK